MGQTIGRWLRGAALLPVALTAGVLAYAQEDDLATRLAALEESVNGSASAYVDNSYLFLIGGIIVMLMAAGFCMLEAGLVRSKNAAMQSTKNVALYSIAGLMFWLVGYNVAYPSATMMNGLFGVPSLDAFFWSGGRGPVVTSVSRAMQAMRRHPTGSSRWCSWRPPRRSCREPWLNA